MRQLMRISLGATLYGLFVSGPILLGAIPAKKTEKVDEGREVVEKVLLREAAGEINRRTELTEALKEKPGSPLLHWQSGYVREGTSWQPYESFQSSTTDADKLARYREQRRNASATPAGQIELANWCRQNGLPEQARAHLHAVLTLTPGQDHSATLDKLGYRRFGNQWLSPQQIAEWSTFNRRAQESIKRWGQKLEKISDQLHGSARQRTVATTNLKQLTDPSVIPAIEYILCGGDEVVAAHAISALQRMPEFEATSALARQAVFAKAPSIRNQATKALKSRTFEEFVPGLIGLMATEVKGEFRQTNHLRHDQFALTYSYIIARETDDQFQVAVLNTVDFRVNEQARDSFGIVQTQDGLGVRRQGTLLLTDRDVSRGEVNIAVTRARTDVTRSIARETYQKDIQVEAFNERTRELNSRIVNVLATASEQNANQNPKVWWQWWVNYNDSALSTDKVVVRVDENDVEGDPTARFLHTSCFAAGTPVWTESGKVSIETIRVGDRVLSKNVDTGELAYKAVLYNSIRKPAGLVKMEFPDENIVATIGHRFWVSGKGWTRACDLQPDIRLHTVTANRHLLSVEAGPTEATYNLVVDDFHTYFVGQNAFLVQDLPMPQPTNSVVPGLTRRQALAATTP